MKFLLALILLSSCALAQEYYFVREGGTYKMMTKISLDPSKPVDTRPLWKRVVTSIRPWTTTSPGTRFHYAFWEDHVFMIEGGVGIGIQGKVDF